MRRTEIIADVALTVAAVAVVVFLGRQVLFPPEIDLPGSAVGASLDGTALGVDFRGRTTLLMVLSSDCVFCQESMPFYRRLLAQKRVGVQIVVAAPTLDIGMEEYLASEDIAPDEVIFTEPGALPVSATPTLLLVDSEGLITYSWTGLLSKAREEGVFEALF